MDLMIPVDPLYLNIFYDSLWLFTKSRKWGSTRRYTSRTMWITCYLL